MSGPLQVHARPPLSASVEIVHTPEFDLKRSYADGEFDGTSSGSEPPYNGTNKPSSHFHAFKYSTTFANPRSLLPGTFSEDIPEAKAFPSPMKRLAQMSSTASSLM